MNYSYFLILLMLMKMEKLIMKNLSLVYLDKLKTTKNKSQLKNYRFIAHQKKHQKLMMK